MTILADWKKEERHRRRHVAMFAEHHVDLSTSAPLRSIARAIEKLSLAMHLDVRFVDEPAAPGLAAPALAQTLGLQANRIG